MMRMLMAPAIIMGLNALKLDYEDPMVIFGARAGFIIVQALLLLSYGFIAYRARKANDQTPVTVAKKPSAFQAASAMASGDASAAAAPASSSTTTVAQYDYDQVMSLVKNVLISSAITCFIHYKWNYVQPLFIQGLLNPVTFVGHPLFNIYFLGKPATGDLKRPFVEENPLGGLMGQPAQQAQPEEQPAVEPDTTTAASAGTEKKTAKIVELPSDGDHDHDHSETRKTQAEKKQD